VEEKIIQSLLLSSYDIFSPLSFRLFPVSVLAFPTWLNQLVALLGVSVLQVLIRCPNHSNYFSLNSIEVCLITSSFTKI
jgi:hypothetical protein